MIHYLSLARQVWPLVGVLIAAAPSADPIRANPFDANVKVTVTDDAWVVESDGLPTHKTGTFPNATNPNRILQKSRPTAIRT